MKKKKDNSFRITIVCLCLLIVAFSIMAPQKTFCANQDLIELSQKLNSAVINELDEIDFSSLNALVDELNENNHEIFSLNNIKSKVYEIISGKNAINYSSVFACIFSIIFDAISKYLPLLSVIVAIGVLSNLLGGIKSKFNEKSTSNLVELVCFFSVVILVVGMFVNLSSTVGLSISNMVKQMDIIFPILLTLMIGLGANASVGVFQPIVAIMSTYVSNIFLYYIVPLFTASFVFNIISNISTSVKLDKINEFISSLFKWSVGLTFTIFFAVFSIQGISAGKFDSLSIRTTKYTIKSYIPIMGGYLSDGMDLILSSTVLIKNSIGLIGILLIISTILSPLIEIAVFSLVMKLVSAILQPMGNTKISNFLSSSSKTIIMLSTAMLAIGFMYIISLGLVVTSTNVVI